MQLSAPDDVESKFRALEGSNVDDDLNQLRAALSSGSKPRAEVRAARRPGQPAAASALPGGVNRRVGRNSTPHPVPSLLQLPPGRPLRDAFDAELDEMRRNRNRGGN